MKKYIYILAAAAFAFAACEKEVNAPVQNPIVEEPVEQELQTYTISVSRIANDTKAYLYGGVEFDWQAGDVIDVWDSNSSSFKQFTYPGGGDDEVVTFTASLEPGTYNWTSAYYPHGVASGETTLTIPAAYASPNAVKPILAAEVGVSTTTFHHVCAYVKVQVNEWPSIANNIVFASAETVAGTYTVTPSTGAITGGSSESNSITVTCTPPDITYGWEVEMLIPVVPSDSHSFSIDVNDTATPTPHTFFHAGDGHTHVYDLPKGKIINMSEIDLNPQVYILANWREDMDLDDDNLFGGTVWPSFNIEREIVLNPATTSYHVVVKYGGLEVPYGLATPATDYYATFVPWQTGDLTLPDTGMYDIHFQSFSGNTSCDWRSTMFLAGISDDWTKDCWNGEMTRIVHNVYGWSGNPENSVVRPYGANLAWITAGNLDVVSGITNIVVVNKDAPDNTEETYVRDETVIGTLPGSVDRYPWWTRLYSGSTALVTEDVDSYGFVHFENVAIATATALHIVAEWNNDPDENTYTSYGLATSGQTLVDGANVATVEDGYEFTLAAGTYDIVYCAHTHHIYIVKK